MSGTFPYLDIFRTIDVRTNLQRIKNLEANNTLVERFKYQQFSFDCKTVPLNRTQGMEVKAFLTSQNGESETFNFPLPRPFSGGAFNSHRNGALGTAPIANQTGYTGGQTQTINRVQSIGDTAIQFQSIASNQVSMSGTHDNSSDSELTGSLDFKVGDFLQFTNHNKLYQLVSHNANFIADNFGGSGFSFISYPEVNFFPPLLSALTTSERMKTNVSPVVRLNSDVIEVQSNINNLYELQFTLVEEI